MRSRHPLQSRAATILALLLAGAVCACAGTAASTRDPVSSGAAKLFLEPGVTTQAEALEAFGGPNVVAGAADGKETWTYDRMSYVRQSRSAGGIGAAYGVVGSTPIAGLLWARAASDGSSSRTVTLFLYWEDGVLTDFRYRSASF